MKNLKLYRKLDAEEEASFRKWARENYIPLEPICGLWHPVIQEECTRINSEHTLDLFGTDHGTS